MRSVQVSTEFVDFESSLEDIVADLTKEIGEKGDKQLKASKKGSRRGSHGIQQMQRTYREICRNCLNPVARYIKAINMGVTTKDMVEVMLVIVSPLLRKTRQVGLDQAAKKLRSFHIVLQQISRSKSSRITATQQGSLEEVYWPVHESFKLDMRGHSVAVANLLSFFRKLKRSNQVTDVEIRKLFSIGIPSLTMVRKSSLSELTSLTGIGRERVSHIRKIAREFQLVWFLE